MSNSYQGLLLCSVNQDGQQMDHMTGGYGRWTELIRMAEDFIASKDPGFQVEIWMVSRIQDRDIEEIRVWQGVSK